MQHAPYLGIVEASQRASLFGRLWAKIPDQPGDDCWEWTGAHNGIGHGKISVQVCGKVKNLYTHRVVYELCRGAIPTGMFVCHVCDNPKCCNPSHLFLGTQTDNMRDCAQKGRNSSSKTTHCPRGHAYDEANTYVYHGARYTRRGCRACDRLRGTAQRAKKAAQRAAQFACSPA